MRGTSNQAAAGETSSGDPLELSIVLPCLDEAQTLQTCIDKAQASLRALGVDGEVLVADNGSTDGSQRIAEDAGARVVDIPVRGYGAALRGGIAQARGRYVLMADADDSYALDDIGGFVEALRDGNELVMGNRFAGGIAPGAMPPLHRYLGNPVLSAIGRLFFHIPVRDFHCGIRAFDRRKAVALDLRSDGMEFASELVVKFALVGSRITEIPTTLKPDGRDRAPHLRSWRDGWRHLRFLLLFSPRWLFLYPGAFLAVVGAALMFRLLFGPWHVGGAALDTQSMLFASAWVIIGSQSVLLALLSRSYATDRGILPPNPRLSPLRHPFILERGALGGVVLAALGLLGLVIAFFQWGRRDFGALDLADSLRLSIPAVTCLVVGVQVLLSSFFLGLLRLDEKISIGDPVTTPPP